jgi:hypothetical protein
MSDSNNADGVSPADGQDPVITDGDKNKKQTVSYDTYDKAMKSLAKEKERLKELEARAAKLEEDKLLSEGKKDELIETYRKRAADLEEATKREKAERMLDRFNAKVAEVSMKKGLKNPAIAQKMFSIKDFELDEMGNVDPVQLESKIDALKATDGYLFSQSGKVIADGNPQTRITDSGNKSLNKMSPSELAALYTKKALESQG